MNYTSVRPLRLSLRVDVFKTRQKVLEWHCADTAFGLDHLITVADLPLRAGSFYRDYPEPGPDTVFYGSSDGVDKGFNPTVQR